MRLSKQRQARLFGRQGGGKEKEERPRTHGPAAPKSQSASGPGHGQQHPKPRFITRTRCRGLTTTLPCPSLQRLLLGLPSPVKALWGHSWPRVQRTQPVVIPLPTTMEHPECAQFHLVRSVPETLVDLALHTSTEMPEHQGKGQERLVSFGRSYTQRISAALPGCHGSLEGRPQLDSSPSGRSAPSWPSGMVPGP